MGNALARWVVLFCGFLFLSGAQVPQQVYMARNGKAYFLSDAPLELISATTHQLAGVLNIRDRQFSFVVPVSTFEGFNSGLQRTHFNEDYLETDRFPNATFKGKIIEEVDLSKPGDYQIRAKGKLNIHGLDKDRIIRCNLQVGQGGIKVNAKFTVFLDDHNIKIPTIVNQKIAKEIQVEIELELNPAS